MHLSTRDYSLADLPLDSPHHPSESAGLLSDSGSPILGPTPDDTEAGYSTPKDVREMKEWVTLYIQMKFLRIHSLIITSLFEILEI